MKKTFLTLAAILMQCAFGFANEIQWISSYQDALAKAKQANKPIMVDYYTSWCGWCKRLDQDTYKYAPVVARSAEFISAKVNAEVDPKSASAHGVSGYPTILFLDSTGKEIWRVGGYKSGPQFLQDMIKAQAQTMPEDLLKEQAKGGDPEAAFLLGQRYLAKNDLANAKTYLQKLVELDAKNKEGYKPDGILDLGFCYFQLRENQKSLETYTTFMGEFKDHARSDEALFYLGWTYQNLNDTENTNLMFNELTQKYPASVYTRQIKRFITQPQK